MSLKVTWYSHASFLIETDKARLLVDPFITGNPLSPVKADEV
jgi:L-ascorbate metabolism protein UlaG (beta-lactamase superfamily)